jgi:hypothetical protein
MEMTCGFCNNTFSLDKIHIKKELTKENPIVKGIMDVILGVKTSEMVDKYFIYCPKCHQKIAKIDY